MPAYAWFRFYADDWMGSGRVSCLSLAQQGLYLRLLLLDWQLDGLPMDREAIRRAMPSEATAEMISELLTMFFTVDGGRWRNPKLLLQRVDAAQRSAKGRDAADARWNAQSNAQSNAPGYAPGHARAMPLRAQGSGLRAQQEQTDVAPGALTSPVGEGGSGESAPARAASVPADVLAVIAHYRAHHPAALRRPRPDSKEVRLIRARLAEGSTVAELCAAIDGYHVSPHHTGSNEHGKRYLALALIMRDASHIQAGLDYREPAATRRAPQLASSDAWQRLRAWVLAPPERRRPDAITDAMRAACRLFGGLPEHGMPGSQLDQYRAEWEIEYRRALGGNHT